MGQFIIFWPSHVAHKILVPQTGVEPVPPAVETRVLTTWTAIKFLEKLLICCYQTQHTNHEGFKLVEAIYVNNPCILIPSGVR